MLSVDILAMFLLPVDHLRAVNSTRTYFTTFNSDTTFFFSPSSCLPLKLSIISNDNLSIHRGFRDKNF